MQDKIPKITIPNVDDHDYTHKSHLNEIAARALFF